MSNVVSVRVDEETRRQLEKLAEQEERTVSQTVRIIIRRALEAS